MFGRAVPAIVISLAARVTGVPYRFDVARKAAGTVLSSTLEIPFYAELANSGLALQAVVDLDVQACGTYYPKLLSTRRNRIGGWVMAGDRLLGLLSQTLGNLDQAVTHFEGVLVFCRKAGYRPELAWTSCDYADTLLQRNNPGDLEKAMSLLDESLAISSELGMRPLMERVLSRREILRA